MKTNTKCKMLVLTMAVLTVLLSSVMPIHAAAAEPGIMPLWTNTSLINLSLGFPDYGYAEATVIGKSGVTKIVLDVYIYRQSGSSWVFVAEKHETVSGTVGGISCQFTPIKGAYYRADYTFTVTKNGVNEIVNKSKYETCE